MMMDHPDAALLAACEAQWAALRLPVDFDQAEFDRRLIAADKVIWSTSPTTVAGAAAKLRVALNGINQSGPICDILKHGGLPDDDHDELDATDAMVVDVIRFLDGHIAAREAWAKTFAEWRMARSAEYAYDRAHVDPALEEADRTRGEADPAILAESERLADVRDAIETGLMAMAAPDAEAVAIKFLIAFGNGRYADSYLDQIEQDATRLCGPIWEAA